jgi:hypothetical protein
VRTRILFCFVLLWALSDPGAFAADPHWVEFPALKEFEGKPVTLTGWLYRPEGNGPFPALVMLRRDPFFSSSLIWSPCRQTVTDFPASRFPCMASCAA